MEPKFVPFLMGKHSKCKISRKKILLDSETSFFFPPEGHVAFQVNVNDTVRVYIFGGSRYAEPSTWQATNSLYTVEVALSSSDINLELGKNITLRGAVLPPLSWSSVYRLLTRKILKQILNFCCGEV